MSSGVVVMLPGMTRILTMIGRRWPGRLATVGACLAAVLAAAVSGSATTATAAVLPQHGPLAPPLSGVLYAVSCASASHCMAVGGLTTAAGSGNLAEKWNGTKWSVVASPDPPGALSTTFRGVDCISANNCLAVGDYTTPHTSNNAHILPTAERWNGKNWSLITVPAPSKHANLDAISCGSATDCWASGFSWNHTLVENWNGSAWSIVSSPSPVPGPPNVLYGMACASARECWSAGAAQGTTSLTERWNGKKWSAVTTPNSAESILYGDTCAGTSACLAVGFAHNGQAIAQQWNGTTWTTAPAAQPSGATSAELGAVSCTGADACVSVGSYYVSSTDISQTLAEGWNGTTWAIETMPALNSGFGDGNIELTGVSCLTASNCWAVGFWDPGTGFTPLIEQWNGTGWSVA
jgi:hypothetical protein